MRQRAYLQERYRVLLSYSGAIVFIIGLLYLIPLLVIPFYTHERHLAPAFLMPGIIIALVGLLVWRSFFPKDDVPHVTTQEGAVVVSVVWLVGLITGTIPFMIVSELTFLQALFESTSAWTTTGLSVVDVTTAPQIVLFYRSLMQLAGGAGLAIITLTAIAGPIGYGLSVAEGRSEQLAGHVRQSANIVLNLYLSYVVIGIVALRLVGMGWFDAVNHAFAALSTGGFSTRVESIGYWDSARVEAVIIVLMILGTTNFLTAYTLLRGKFVAIYHNGELRTMATMIAVTLAPLLLLVTMPLYESMEKALRVALFEVVSAISTTGFSTVSYTQWSDFGWLMLIILMLVGGGTGSTAGGIKQYRIYILYKAIKWEFRKAFLPAHAVNEPHVWQGERHDLLTDQQVRQVALYVGLYASVFLCGTGIMVAAGYPLRDSLFEFASSLSTVGLSVGITTPDMPAVVMFTQVLAMLLGRLEFFALLIGLVKITVDVPVMLGAPVRA